MVDRNAKGQFTSSPGHRPRDHKTGKFTKSPFAPVLFEDVPEPHRGTGWLLLGLAVVVAIVAVQVFS